MQKTKLQENITLYSFPPSLYPKYGFNILVLSHGSEALVIDTAYPNEAKAVREDLEKEGLKPKQVVISHFHPDHIAGGQVFADCSFAGSREYKSNMANCKAWEPQYNYVEPTVLLKDGDTLDFGPHRLRFMAAPGHCECNMVCIINDEMAFVGDLIMYSAQGKDMLPYICEDGGFEAHISSLERLANLDVKVCIPAHGPILHGKEAIEEAVQDRLHYLKKTWESKGKLTIEACLKKNPESYISLEWHELNVMRL